jgi:hypothetical protein
MDALFSRTFGTSMVYTLLPTVQNSDYFDLCNVGVMVLFIFLASVQTARLQIQIYVFITTNVCCFVRYWGLWPKLGRHIVTFLLIYNVLKSCLNLFMGGLEPEYLSLCTDLEYGLDNRGIMARFPNGTRKYPPPPSRASKPPVGYIQPPSQWVTGPLSGREDEHLASSARVKNAWIYTSIPHIHLYGARREDWAFIYLWLI